jgi:putative membrane protein
MKARHTFPAAAILLGLMAMLACDRREENRKTSGARSDRDQTARTGDASSDKAFLEKAAQANWGEIETGRLAEAKASSADVRDFGKKMVEDHGQANEKVMDLAAKKGVRLEGSKSDPTSSLSGLSGSEFDKKYVSMMVSDHTKAVSLFEDNAKNAKDKDVRDFAEKTLPTLREHLKMARDLSSKVGAPSAD